MPGPEGVVDLYLMPTYDDMASLYFDHGNWMIHYAFPPHSKGTHPVAEALSLTFGEETINQVLDAIADHAVPSF